MSRLPPALFLLLAAATLSGCERNGRAATGGDPADAPLWVGPEEVRAGAVRVLDVKEQDFTSPVPATGRIAFDDLAVSHLYAPVTGRVTRVLVSPGERVARGAPLLTLLSPDAGSAVADLVKAEADLDAASRELARQRLVVGAHAGPSRDLEAAEDARARALAERQRAAQKAKLLQLPGGESVRQEYTLRSFIAGRVISRAVNPGMEVQGQYGGGGSAELFTIGELDRVWAMAEVAEGDLPRIRRGADAEVRVVAFPDRVFRGKVEWIADALDPALRTARVRVTLANPDRALKPEMYASLRIATAPERLLAIPREAVVQVGDEPYALVAERQVADGRIEFRRRRIAFAGPESAGALAVASGLAPGDRVAVDRGQARAHPSGEAHLGAEQARGAGIRTAAAALEDLPAAVQLTARVSFDDQRMAHLFSPVSGRVSRVLAAPGERVKKGQPLLAISSPEVGAALAELAKARADQVAALHERRRQEELVAAHAGARKDLEAAESAWRKACAEEERAAARGRLLAPGSVDEVRQEYLLRSPIDGAVIARNVSPGLEVQGLWSGAQNAPELFTVGELDRLWLLAEVYEQDLPLLHAGQEVTVPAPGAPGGILRGRVEWVSEVLDPIQRTARVRCVVPDPGKVLRPEMVARVTVVIPGRRGVAVPRSALVRRGDATVVFVATEENGQLQLRERRVSADEERPTGSVSVRAGLEAGERVVVDGTMLVMGML